MSIKQKRWRRLDSSAKLFPILSNKKSSSVFRLSVVLKENINVNKLIKAVEIALIKFDSFKVMLKKGLFWYYLQYNTKAIIVEEEQDYPCKYIDPYTNNHYLFKVTYFDKKINMDVFHTLTDGNSAMHFFKEIIYTYLELNYPDELKTNKRIDRNEIYSIEDSYIKNYDKKFSKRSRSKKAFLLRGRKLPLDAIRVTHVFIDIQQLRSLCKEKKCTVTQYLTANLILSIYQENYLSYKGKRPIKVCIPVNLKKYFKSNTLSNFFSYITVEANMRETKTFDTILDFVKQDFKMKLTQEEILKTMGSNIKLGNQILIKVLPLFLKKIAVKLSYLEIQKYTTTTFSNVGRIGIIGEYKKYIDTFLFLIAPERKEKIKCSACTYEDKLIFTFTSNLFTEEIEKRFANNLIKKGIQVETKNNGV